jgi:Ser/Thr protein kinase RdoA (MazF antagonist)
MSLPENSFFSLTPERVLDAVECTGVRCTGRLFALNSLENRVYDVELEDNTRIIAKFYRPGRWSKETITDEHTLLLALAEHEIPVCAPVLHADGHTLHTTPEGLHVALFPRVGGRSPDECTVEEYQELGRLLARIHAVSESLNLQHRPALSPTTYGTDALNLLLQSGHVAHSVEHAYADAVHMLVQKAQTLWPTNTLHVIHADCHRGNLLKGSQGWFFLDFDDMASGPAVQDMWLLWPARQEACPREVEAMVEGYIQFKHFNTASLACVEALRGLRYVRYAAWVAQRWQDPAFKHAFPEWGTETYWQRQLTDLYEQIRILSVF